MILAVRLPPPRVANGHSETLRSLRPGVHVSEEGTSSWDERKPTSIIGRPSMEPIFWGQHTAQGADA